MAFASIAQQASEQRIPLSLLIIPGENGTTSIELALPTRFPLEVVVRSSRFSRRYVSSYDSERGMHVLTLLSLSSASQVEFRSGSLAGVLQVMSLIGQEVF